jgi:hypothetical protein
MTIAFLDLWRPSGKMDRGTYAVVGVLGFALKHNLDRAVATYGFHRPWGLFNYWVPVRDVARITEVRGSEAVFLGTMVALSLPFIWIGVVLTMKRLRSTGLPSQLVALFFVPLLNLVFFLMLCLLPDRDTLADQKAGPRKVSSLVQVFPESALGSAAVSLLITVPVGLGLAVLGAQALANYGWGLFVALPFSMGFAAALIYGIREPRGLSGCVWVALLSVVLLGAGLLALAFEGAVCLYPGRRVDRTRRCTAVSDVGGAYGNRRPGPPGKSLERSGCVFPDSAAGGMAVSGRHRISHSRRNGGQRCRRGAALRVFDGSLCRAHPGLG